MIQETEATIELRVRSMEHAIVHALTLYEGKLNEEIKDLVHAMVVGFDFKKELEEELRREVRSQLMQACRDAIRGQVTMLIQERVQKAINSLNEKD